MKDYTKPESFKKNGFRIVKSVLNENELSEYRKKINEIFTSYNHQRMLWPNQVLSHQFLFSIPFNQKIVSALKECLGTELAYFSDFQLQHNVFGSITGTGWHKDSDSEILNDYLIEPNYRFAKCGLFFQNNTHSWGGGIDVLPGDHNSYGKKTSYMGEIINRIKTEVKKRFLPLSVHIDSGDFVFFDSRLYHRSSKIAPENIKNINQKENYFIEGIPQEYTKYVLYWNACNKDMVDDFLTNSRIRTTEESPSTELFFTDYIKNKFPEDYPDEYVKMAIENRITIASLDKFHSDLYKVLFDKYNFKG